VPSPLPSNAPTTPIPPPAKRPVGSRWSYAFLIDIAVFFAVFGVIFAIYSIGRSWLGPVKVESEISQDPRSLWMYALYTLVRILIAYVISLLFALAYGYAAAKSKRAEMVLIPLLDILQSIPVLSFLPGVMLAMVTLFPSRQLGVELGSIVLIFTGQVWNIAFSFYSSLKTIPRDLREAAIIYRFSRWQRFVELDLPFSTIGLVWNSMMSVAGGWFFLMACEMFVLGDKDFRLPGLGSFLQTAADAKNTRAVLWGLAMMVGIIVLMDQLIWRPVIAWADKFKFEQVESAANGQNAILDFIRRESYLIRGYRRLLHPIVNWLTIRFASGAKRAAETFSSAQSKQPRRWLGWLFLALGAVSLVYAVYRTIGALTSLSSAEYLLLLKSAALTFLRVNLALIIGALWTIPLGVAIGFSPRFARLMQPLVQLAASIPATALFPVMLLVLIRLRGGVEIAAMALMLLGTQWYILFNVIAGAMAIPTDLKEAAKVFGFSRWDRWRHLILPGIFPYLVTGLVTASGGAWNASIVAEYFHFQGRVVEAPGLGSTISQASGAGQYNVLLASTLLMATIVVLINRLVWRRMYRLAASRFKLES
jgi:NitT/TauT family transport system permease protein